MGWYPLLPGESIEIRASEPGVSGMSSRFYGSWEEAHEVAVRNAWKYDVYFGVAPRVPDEHGKLAGTAKNVARCPLVWLDLDAKEGWTKESRLAQLKEAEPSILVDSGNGFHAYWLLDRDMAPDSARQVMREMAEYFQADRKATDPARILRWPDTINHKQGENLPVQLIHANLTDSWNPEALPRRSVTDTSQYHSNRSERVRLIETFGVPHKGGTLEGEHFDGRNSALFEVALHYKDLHWERDDVLAHLLKVNELNQPPLHRDEVEGRVRSAFTYSPPPRITEVVEAPSSTPGLTTLVEPSRNSFQMIDFNELGEPTEPTFLWEPYFLLNRLVLLDGEEGIGKGLMLCMLAAQLSDKYPFAWFTAEDDPIDDVKPRVRAARKYFGANGDINICFSVTNPRFNADKQALFDMLEQTIVDRSIKVLVLDPGRSFIGPREGQRDFNYNNEADVRPTMQSFMRISRDHNVAIIFVHHFNKNSTAPLRYRTTGSGAWRQVVRQQVTMLWDPVADDGVFGVQKSNIGPTGFVRGYRKEIIDHWAVLVPSDNLDPITDLQTWADQRSKVNKTPITVIEPEVTVEQVRDWAFAELKNGDDFPSRGELAKVLSLSHETVRVALKTLREEGWLIRPKGRQGGGYVWNPLWRPDDAPITEEDDFE